ncbi:zinc finger E-box-binding homeobox 1 [Austrofundulus limnaeus]|uniref:Zinc finger E-box-binding homeobox 1 n=1 Tax=Austrofundulus limnaeus TaxID=52670 RepID=A0A2I4BK58_AUSLI|nr:PREDICTED: zinc finger E-box-binding homeobox 1-like [Austrofundulus limnaeus]
MDPQLASVLTSGSLEVQNGSLHGEDSGTEVVLDPKDETSSPSTKPGNLKSCLVKAAVTIRRDAQSINGKKPEVGGTCEPASQETSKIGGLRQPIKVKPGVPALRGQPVRIKIVVPPGRKKPIANSAVSLTKDCAAPQTEGPVLSSAQAPVAGKSRGRVQRSAARREGDIRQDASQKAEEGADAESFLEEEEEEESKDTTILDVKTVHMDESEMSSVSHTTVVQEDAADGEAEQHVPQILRKTNSDSLKLFDETEEQTEPLDLSLPKKRVSRDRSHGRLVGDPGGESSLIMEVDEYEGDGDRDMVEEDVNEGSEGPLLSPSFFSTSVLMSLSPVDCDTEDLLLIDDQGIPYTLSPDGLKVPQVDASMSGAPQSDQVDSAEQEEKSSSHSATLAGPSFSQSLDLAPSSAEFDPPSADEPSPNVNDPKKSPEIFSRSQANPDPPELNVDVTQEANGVVSPASGLSLPTQPIQILTNSSTNPPLLLLSSSSSGAAGLSLPLSVAPMSPGASTPVILLLSSVSASSDDSSSTSTAAFAVLDPSTGQLSQVTASSAPLSLPLSSAQVGGLGPMLSSNPVVKLSPGGSPLVLSGVSPVTPGPALTSLTVPSSALQDSHLSKALQSPNYSGSNPGSEAISAEKSELKKPSTCATTSPQPPPATREPLAPPASQATAQSPASEPKLDPSDLHPEHLPLDDHLYFLNSAAPPSPPIGPLLPSAKLDSLEGLDPLSPEESPNSLSSRRVLCCQLCPRIFFYLSDLERHAITHSQKKPHVCQQCGKAFKRSSHLQRHKHIHTGQRNFVCPICSKRFREAGELQRHQRVHTGEKPYQCQLCHTRFAERNTLRRHTKRKHPYHQVAMEMLNERRERGGDGGGGGGRGGVQEEEESAEWYSSAVSTLDNSESEMET